MSDCQHEWEQVWMEWRDGEMHLTGGFRCKHCRTLQAPGAVSDEVSAVVPGAPERPQEALRATNLPSVPPVEQERQEALVDAMVLGHGQGQEHAVADIRALVVGLKEGTTKPPRNATKVERFEWEVIQGTLNVVLAEIDRLASPSVVSEPPRPKE